MKGTIIRRVVRTVKDLFDRSPKIKTIPDPEFSTPKRARMKKGRLKRAGNKMAREVKEGRLGR